MSNASTTFNADCRASIGCTFSFLKVLARDPALEPFGPYRQVRNARQISKSNGLRTVERARNLRVRCGSNDRLCVTLVAHDAAPRVRSRRGSIPASQPRRGESRRAARSALAHIASKLGRDPPPQPGDLGQGACDRRQVGQRNRNAVGREAAAAGSQRTTGYRRPRAGRGADKTRQRVTSGASVIGSPPVHRPGRHC